MYQDEETLLKLFLHCSPQGLGASEKKNYIIQQGGTDLLAFFQVVMLN